MLGEKANRFKAPYLYGKHGSRCGGHKCEGERALPEEICQSAFALPASRGVGMGWQKSAEAIVVGVSQRRAEPTGGCVPDF